MSYLTSLFILFFWFQFKILAYRNYYPYMWISRYIILIVQLSKNMSLFLKISEEILIRTTLGVVKNYTLLTKVKRSEN